MMSNLSYNLYFAIYLLYYISLEHTSMLSYLNLPRTYVSFIFIRWSSSYGNNEERNELPIYKFGK